MDLMGSDAIQSEDAMRRMWGDSVKAVQCQHARITYDDFLLLMKGQTKEPSHDLERELKASVVTLKAASARQLHVVPELPVDSESPGTSPPISAKLPGADEGVSTPEANPAIAVIGDSEHTPPIPFRASGLPSSLVHSAPSTPANHKPLLDGYDLQTGGSIDGGDSDIFTSGPGVPGSSASLTPPQSPLRGVHDFVTPSTGGRFVVTLPESVDSIVVPGLPAKPAPYERRRSRSVDDQDKESEPNEQGDLHELADAVRDMIVPEAGSMNLKSLEQVVNDESKSALVVNRQLYRAHRQMRLAVLEASKRFEEQQAAHAREVILAQREADGTSEQSVGMIQAGLVMRHGHKKQVSSEAIRTLLAENKQQQQALVEKATRRGGRGRRSRKKTISDMSGMMSTSLTAEEMGGIAAKASANSPPSSDEKKLELLPVSKPPPVVPELPIDESPDDGAPEGTKGQMRSATIPGEFHKVSDPFGKAGKYGHAHGWK